MKIQRNLIATHIRSAKSYKSLVLFLYDHFINNPKPYKASSWETNVARLIFEPKADSWQKIVRIVFEQFMGKKEVFTNKLHKAVLKHSHQFKQDNSEAFIEQFLDLLSSFFMPIKKYSVNCKV